MSPKRIGIVGTVIALCLAGGSAMADEEDHQDYHQELDAEHADVHDELDAQHGQFHATGDAQYQRMIAMCYGDWVCERMVQRRMARRHRVEHTRENMDHQLYHDQAADEHDTYHQITGTPDYGSSDYGSSYYGTPNQYRYRYQVRTQTPRIYRYRRGW